MQILTVACGRALDYAAKIQRSAELNQVKRRIPALRAVVEDQAIRHGERSVVRNGASVFALRILPGVAGRHLKFARAEHHRSALRDVDHQITRADRTIAVELALNPDVRLAGGVRFICLAENVEVDRTASRRILHELGRAGDMDFGRAHVPAAVKVTAVTVAHCIHRQRAVAQVHVLARYRTTRPPPPDAKLICSVLKVEIEVFTATKTSRRRKLRRGAVVVAPAIRFLCIATCRISPVGGI